MSSTPTVDALAEAKRANPHDITLDPWDLAKRMEVVLTAFLERKHTNMTLEHIERLVREVLVRYGESTPLSTIPVDDTCPRCGKEGELYPIVDGAKHLRANDFSANGSFEEGASPDEQCVRLYCESCSVCLPITDTLARELQLKAETT